MKTSIMKSSFIHSIYLAIAIFIIAISTSFAQKPKPITDTVPAGKPEVLHSGSYIKIYRNEAGQVYKTEEYYDSTLKHHKQTRYVDEVYPNGKPAKETYVKGDKDANGLDVNVTEQTVVYYDPQQRRIKTEVYSDIDKDGVATTKTVTEGGKTSVYKFDPKTNSWVPKDSTGSNSASEPEKKTIGPTRPLGGDDGVSPDTNKKKNGVALPDKNSSSKTITGVGNPCSVAGRQANLKLAEERIQKYIGHVDSRQQQMTTTFYYTGAAATVAEAFKQAGISKDRMGYADSWGKNGIGLTWSQATKSFYVEYAAALQKIASQIQQRGFVSEGEMAKIDQAMGRWDDSEHAIEKQFQNYVQVYVNEAKLLDEKENSLAPLNEQRSALSRQTPYPSDAIYALNNRISSVSKMYDDRFKAIENGDEQNVPNEIARLAQQRYLSSIADIQPCR